MQRALLIIIIALWLAPAAVGAQEPVNVNVAMPDLTCGKGEQLPNECTLSGRLSARGPQTMNGRHRYYCDLRYSYMAAGSEQQEIRFSGRVLHHGEVTLVNGRARMTLEAPVTITLTQQAQRIELTELACYPEP